jgi:hypothetical protein
LNDQQFAADLASKPVHEIAAGATVDAVKRYRGNLINALHGNGNGTLAQINFAAGYTVGEDGSAQEVVIDAGTFARFMKGDLVQAATNSSGAPGALKPGSTDPRGYMRVVDIDTDARAITLESESGHGNVTLADNDHLVLAGTWDFVNGVSLSPEGFESLLINTGNFPGSSATAGLAGTELAVTTYSELKSFVAGDETATVEPTMDRLTLLMDKILDTGRQPPTALIAERSLWTRWAQLERENQSVIQVPMGSAFTATGGVAGPILSHMEHRFQKFTSVRARPGSVIGISPSTWRRFMPMGDRNVRWVFGSGIRAGFPSVFGPVWSGTQLTESAQALFNSFAEFGCVDPRANFRRIGLKTQRDVA